MTITVVPCRALPRGKVVAYGKRLRAIAELLEEDVCYDVDTAFELFPKTANAKFDESVDVAVRLGVDPRVADQMVRGAISLPHGIGKSIRVVVFAEGDAARAAEAAGADVVGGAELVTKIQKEGWVEFDKAISTRAMMAKVGRLGRVLGPRGLMPNPKSGTVVAPEAIADVVKAVKGGRVDFRVDKAGIIHAPIGKSNMEAGQIKDNFLSFLDRLVKLKPASAKGSYIKSVGISSTMGLNVRLDANDVLKRAVEAGR
jgi:large subunit ribosomal protein L1